MYFHDIIGHEALKAELISSVQMGIIHHAQLFVGRDGEGALGLAYAYARYLNCTQRGETDACGHCPSCKRYDTFAEQDLFHLFPIVNASGKNLAEDTLPEWRSFLAQGPYVRYDEWLSLLGGDGKKASIFAREGEALQQSLSYQMAGTGYRIVLIWLPEKMQEALGNKLLKLVEEPPARTIILMVTMEEEAVLGTLRSRMQTLRLQPLAPQVIEEALHHIPQGTDGVEATLAAHLSEGNYRVALDSYLGRSEEHLSQERYLQRILRATVNAQPTEMKLLAEELATTSRDEQLALITYLARMFREFYLFNLDLPKLNYLTSKETSIASYLRSCITGQNVRVVESELDLARRHIAQNVNSKMVFFDLLLRLTSALAPSYRQQGIR
ncbi:DNA polymerase III subunit [Porphyromonas catoniae]|jgi:DNA polymerase III, delta prime subunit, putative|uniref:DNA polymerase III, delta subunit n=1 Tax=Porphyromonas catoniae ATCC 51270 TaxID=887901 RepID=Z4WUB5_9PORP|nr:DNA polymerase III subunit delta [Porphyromonas catoniae]EWC93116.1 DNA polymerase III, delta subunit [Porphyromonas catoniae ATCC 51270]